ncbi:IclR family transcriptional regulator [Halomarina ordinaria]|uniref:IclR family transcriptional regulator n=1 Tax=Halomarina ordinaria TaxID=3033939 RepID=A0ABD5UBD7_9EURY|nr:IclR family transcriptional regulator [Halomarina sp. PSRA2]
MPKKTDSSAGTVSAVETTFAILEQLSEMGGAGVSDLATALGRSKSNVHKHLTTLRELGYVTKGADDTYYVGLRFLGLGDRARARTGLYEVAKAEVDSLIDSVGERGQVMVEEEGRGIYIYQAKTEQAVRTDSYIGTMVALHATAVGKSYLAFLDEDKRSELLEAIDLTDDTESTITDYETLKTELKTIRDRGFAFNDEERTVGMRAVGAPILTDEGRVIGAISISGPTTRINGDWYREEIPKLVQRSARVIGLKVTYS